MLIRLPCTLQKPTDLASLISMSLSLLNITAIYRIKISNTWIFYPTGIMFNLTNKLNSGILFKLEMKDYWRRSLPGDINIGWICMKIKEYKIFNRERREMTRKKRKRKKKYWVKTDRIGFLGVGRDWLKIFLGGVVMVALKSIRCTVLTSIAYW